MADPLTPEQEAAVDERVRRILRAELNDYIQNASILPIKIQGSDINGDEPADGDMLKYNATEQVMEVAP
jgi:hypothetical protein